MPTIHPLGTRNPFKNSPKGVAIFINEEPCLKIEKESTSSDCCMVKNSTTESNYPSKLSITYDCTCCINEQITHSLVAGVIRVGAPTAPEVTLRLNLTVKASSCVEPGSSFSDPQCSGKGKCITQPSEVRTFLFFTREHISVLADTRSYFQQSVCD